MITGSAKATAILDFQSPAVDVFASARGPPGPTVEYVRAAHRHVAQQILPVYTLDELQPISVTIAKGRGSCSQRLACLEGLARRAGVATRVRGLWIRGSFWIPRFRRLRFFLPRRVLLAWPQFSLDGRWLGVEELFLAFSDASVCGVFTNSGETLFEAIAATTVDFEGRARQAPQCDLSETVLENLGLFASRDELFRSQPLLQKTLRGRVFERLWGGRGSVPS
jgi:hypothetical protein